MKKVLVIGGSGFIGKNILEKFNKEGYDVTSFDLNKVNIDGIASIEGNFFDDDQLLNAIKDKDIIIHSLSILNPTNSNSKYLEAYQNEFVQCTKLFSWISETDKKLIYLSSGGTVYGNQQIQPIKEEQLPLPINHYGCLKLCIENTLRTFNKQTKKNNMKIARISNPYGPGQDFKKGVGFIDAILKKALNNEELEIWGDGSVVRDYIYIDDVAEMIMDIVNFEGTEEVFNVSSGIGISLLDIVNNTYEMGLNINVKYKPSRSVDLQSVVLDNSKIRNINSQKKLTPINVGMKNYYEYIKKNNNLDKKCEVLTK